MSEKLKRWIANQMEMSMGFSDASLIQHILSIDNETEASRYLKEFFGAEAGSRIAAEFVKQRFPQKNSGRKKDRGQFEPAGFAITTKGKNKKGRQKKPAAQAEQKNEPSLQEPRPDTPKTASDLSDLIFGKKEEPQPPPVTNVAKGQWAKKPEIPKDDFILPEKYRPKEQPRKTKKKIKYRNINENSDVIILPGRHQCDCQAQKHNLIGNCLSCGRIICEQEGEGPCLFCGVALNLNYSSKSDALLRAISHKDRLLEFDRNSTRRTQVIDDETDYYKGLDEQKIREERYGSRLNKKFTLNLDTEDLEERTLDQFIMDESAKLPKQEEVERENRKENLFFNEDLQSNRFIFNLKNSDINSTKPKSDKTKAERKFNNKNRVQDERLKEMFDGGTCLTMHQPWASLLIRGIKIHEGRVWNSSHRGRLWIHSSVQPPNEDEINNQLTKAGLFDQRSEMDWPTGCLLGFCTVTDVLSQEDYREQYPDGPSAAPYVFICEDVHELDFKPQISGQHKLWKLPREAHQSARAQLHL